MVESLVVVAQAGECGTKNAKSHHHNDPTTAKPADNTTTMTMIKRPKNHMYPAFVRLGLYDEMVKQVVRKKLAKQRHLVLPKAIQASFLESLFAQMLQRHLFQPQTVLYNGGVANVPEWKISCYLEVMDGGIPTAEPNVELLQLYLPVLDAVDVIFMDWYRQQHACNDPGRYSRGKGRGGCTSSATMNSDDDDDDKNKNCGSSSTEPCRRLMTFITRYTPRPGEQALLKHVDGAGKVDGSVVVALPMDESSPFEGGGLTVWDGVKRNGITGKCTKDEIHYDTRCGDLALIDRAVWHQADPITSGTRWALVIFYKVL